MRPNTSERNVEKPSAWVSFFVLAAAVSVMAYISLVTFADRFITLAYGLPLLLCLWRQDKRLLWAMAAAMLILATFKAFVVIHARTSDDLLQWSMHALSILAIAIAVHLVINVTNRLHAKNEDLDEANQELRVVVQFHEENPNPVLRIDHEGKVLYANASAEALLAGEGWRAGDIAPPVLLEPAESALHWGKSFAMDVEFEREVFVHFSFIPLPSGSFVNVYGRDVTAERQVEKALRQSEELFRGTFENAGVGVSHVDRYKRFVRINRYLAKLLGYTPEQLTMSDFTEVTWPEDRTGDPVLFERLVNGEMDNYSVQKRYRRADGQAVWTLITRSAQRDELGNFMYAITIVQDISELHAINEKLARYELLASNTRDIVLFVRLEDWRIIEANIAAERAYGYTRDELLQMTIQDLRAPTTHVMTAEQLNEAYDKGLLFEVVHQRKDGSPFPAEVSARGALVDGKRMLISVVRDISDRKRAEEALRQSEETARARADELNAIMEAVPAPTLIAHDAQGHYITGNSAAYAFFRSEPGSNLCWDDPNVIRHVKVAKGGVEVGPEEWPVQKALFQGKTATGEELELIFDDGTVGYVVGNIAPVRDAEGNVRGAVAVFVDIGARKIYEEQLKNLAENLRRSNKDLERFAYVASHDLQEPLRQIVAFADMVDRRYSEKLDKDGQDFIGFIIDGGKRMQNLIQDLLAYSRVGRKEEARRLTDLNKIVERVLAGLKLRIEEEGAVITTDPMPELVVDPTQFEQVFQNLLSNAIKFRGKDRPIIHLGARREKGYWLFWVRDNGIGFEQEEARGLFQMFHRLHERSKYAGTGIGLAICKRIVELHGGQIWAESKVGEGSTFFFTVPQTLH